jgi:hypothetical protein
LLSALVRKKLVVPSSYQSQSEQFLTEANYELKRFNSSANAEGQNGKSDQNLIEALSKAIEKTGTHSKRSAMMEIDLDGDRDEHPLIVDYAYLLTPLYHNKDVKPFFVKLLKTKNTSVLFPVYINLLENGINANDSVWSYLSSQSQTRLKLYKELKRLNRLDLFDKKYLNQQSLCEAEILRTIDIEHLYDNNAEKSKSEITFLSSVDASNKYEKGKIYIFKRNDPRLREGIEKWTYAFVPEGKEINDHIEVLNTAYFADKDLSPIYVNELVNDFGYAYRTRYIPDSWVTSSE